MKTIFILWVATVGAEYEYEGAGDYDTLGPCVTDALAIGPDQHAYCAPETIITQPDGSVRPRARPAQ